MAPKTILPSAPPEDTGLKKVREIQIYEFIKEKGRYCTADELVKVFRVSPVTIHRALTALAQQGLVRKLTGGVELAPGPDGSRDSHFSARIERRRDEKNAIAAKALSLVREGDFIFLDSSTTAYYLARRIRQGSFSELTLMTNSILIIQEFHLFPPHLQLLAVGGRYHPQLHSLLGRASLDALRELRPRRLFFSAAAVHLTRGISSFHEDHAEFLAALLPRCDEKILLLDSSKFDQEGLFRLADLSAVDVLVTDEGLGPAGRARYAEAVRRIL